MSLTIGIDIGGTNIRGAVVDRDGEVVAQSHRDTPAEDPSQIVGRIVEVIRELAAAHEVGAVGIGAAGWIDQTRSTILFAPNLAWRDEPLREKVSAEVDLPVFVENDANVAAWAEFTFGAARAATDSMVLYTVGTGIGGGIVLGGRLVRGSHGMAAEMGHTMMVPGGHPCGCGRLGCSEQYASGSALVRFARAAAAADPARAADLLALAGGTVDGIEGPLVTRAARDGDAVAIDAFTQVGHWLGVALADMVQVLDPEVFVIGGGVIDAGELLLRPTRASYTDALAERARLPVADIVAASMGSLAGVVGAADLARRN